MLPCKSRLKLHKVTLCQVCGSLKQVTKPGPDTSWRQDLPLDGRMEELMTARLSTIDVFKTFGLSVRTREVAIKRGKKYSEQRSVNAKVGRD